MVSAAHRDRLEAYTWWYPIVGRVPYRGFFERARRARGGGAARARRARRRRAPGDRLQHARLVRRSAALDDGARRRRCRWWRRSSTSSSTQTLYVPGEPAFNECAATFVGRSRRDGVLLRRARRDAARCDEARRRVGARRARAAGSSSATCGALRRALREPAAARRARERAARAAGGARPRARPRARGLGSGDDAVAAEQRAAAGRCSLYATAWTTFEAPGPDGDGDPGRRSRASGRRGARARAIPFAARRARSRPPSGNCKAASEPP